MTDDSREVNILKGVLNLAVVLVAIAIIVGTALGNSGSGDSDGDASGVVWEIYDVAIDVREDGTLHVTERQDVRFDGDFSEGFVTIPLDRVGSIDNVQVTTEGRPEDLDGNSILTSDELDRDGELMTSRQVSTAMYDGEAGTHHVTEENGELVIEYGFEPTGSATMSYLSGSQVRTIVLEYDVAGAIRDYPDAAEPWQQLHWLAISKDVTGIADIRSASVTVTLPEDVPVEELAYAPEPEEVSTNMLTWPSRSMGEGDAFDVQVAFPAITAATTPDWQPAADAHDAAAEDRDNQKALGSVLLIAAGVLAAVGGGLCLLYAWYTRIREPAARPEMDIITAPPADLPAGLVGALVDEAVQPRDVAAIVMDLDRRGVIRIVENTGQENGRFGGHPRYAVELKEPIASAQPYEQVVLKAIFGANAAPPATESFNALRPLFGVHREAIQSAMDEEFVRRGYYAELPATSRHRWQLLLKVFLGLTVAVAAGILIWTRSWSWVALLPPVLGVVIYLAGKRLTPSIARKTLEGAEVAGDWRAFQRHLESKHWSSFANERAEVYETYLPWVVAFGIDTRWLGEMNTSAPAYASTPLSRPTAPDGTSWQWPRETTQRGTSDSGSWTTSGGLSLPDWRWVGDGWDAGSWSDLQSGSNRALGAVQGGSNAFFSMLGDAMEALGSASGGSGGSSSRGGSFGGSSRSGGGHSRSSSGGGSRGFR
ncbi:MAG TPA: DUF2207 domain-containing protein [Thermomicrobiales bacterium]|nr:DUF2207 domain-containing protein [Thermomicrobiales bacterium]